MKSQITIRTTDGSKTVIADVFGAWAVHEAWTDVRCYAITHVASGYCVPPFYTEDLSRATAIRVAKALDAHYQCADPFDKEAGRKMADLIQRVSLGASL